MADHIYNALSTTQLQQLRNRRLQELEHNLFGLLLEVAELDGVLAVATVPQDKQEAERERETALARIDFVKARIVAVIDYVIPDSNLKESTE